MANARQSSFTRVPSRSRTPSPAPKGKGSFKGKGSPSTPRGGKGGSPKGHGRGKGSPGSSGKGSTAKGGKSPMRALSGDSVDTEIPWPTPESSKSSGPAHLKNEEASREVNLWDEDLDYEYLKEGPDGQLRQYGGRKSNPVSSENYWDTASGM
jgi:hypothetical protein